MNRIVGARLILAVVLMVPIIASCQPERVVSVDLCGEKLRAALVGASSDPHELVNAVESLESECLGSAAYDVALTYAYLGSGRFQDASVTGRRGLALPEADVEGLSDAIFSAEVALGNLPQAKQVVDDLFAKDERSPIGQLLLAKYLVASGREHEAIDAAKAAVAAGVGPDAFRVLTTAYYNANMFKEAVSSFELGRMQHESLVEDINAVLPASASYYEVGNKSASLDVLETHVRLVPESRQVPLFQKMYGILTE